MIAENFNELLQEALQKYDEQKKDIVEVVRCKDCVFGQIDTEAEMYLCRSVTVPLWHRGEHYCADGVSKEK